MDKGREFIPMSKVIDTESVSVTNDVRESSIGKNLQIKKGIHRGLIYDMCYSVCVCTIYMHETWLYCGRPQAGTAPLLCAACDFLGREAGPPYLTVLVLA